MNEHHRIALANACRFGFETTNPKLHWLDGAFSYVLSVNSGYE